MDSREIFRRLRAPFSARVVKWRVGAVTDDRKLGQALPYIDVRAVQNRLDEVLGPENWQTEIEAQCNGSVFVCRLSLRINGEWLTKSDGAQVDNYARDRRANAKEMALKGAISDALKRAAVQWGIGRYLYEFDGVMVPLDQNLQPVSTPKLPAHLLPENERERAQQHEPEVEGAQAAAPRASARTPTAGAAPSASDASKVAAPAPNVAAHAAAKATTRKVRPASSATRPESMTPAADVSETPADKATPMASATADNAGTTASKAVPVAMVPLEELPEDIRNAGLTADQLKRVQFVLEQLRTRRTPVGILSRYLTGARNADLPQTVRDRMLEFVARA